jgi:hypothetical protein
MAENDIDPKDAEAQADQALKGGAYELIRNRLKNHSQDLRQRLDRLNEARKTAFGSVEHKLLSSDRISTDNNCVPRDMVPIGDQFIFGYNVFVGLRTETNLNDVFSIYQWKDGNFSLGSLEILQDRQFEEDFKNLYRFYRKTTFAKFSVIGTHLFMVFRVGRQVKDIKTFKWLIQGNTLKYLDNRSDHEFGFPGQHAFEWQRATQDMFHEGRHPHVSIADRVFVETIGGDLTVKIEDNTETGEGIYSEPVDNTDQALSDAIIYYAIVGNVILLKIRPYEERDFRYILYNEKIQKARRIDAIEEACLLLPEDHGLIFPKGYYLQTGTFKLFDTDMKDMVFERRQGSPNGEDTLFIFYNRDSGAYCLLSYNMIEQKISTPVICSGYSFFENGTLIYFRADEEPKKHHVIQTWQTPYYGSDFSIPVKSDSELYKIGNKDIVRCMAECTEILTLIGQEDTFANLYLDIARKAEDICDTYFWIDSADTFNLNTPLDTIRGAANGAIEEHEKVLRTKEHTRSEIERISQSVRNAIQQIDYNGLDNINQFVEHLTQLRTLRGEVVSLKDLRYADQGMITTLETEVADHTDQLSQLCVEFLLDPNSLAPYGQQAEALGKQVTQVTKVTEAKELQEQVGQTGTELEMLTDIVSNLKIEDATQTIAIIDNISVVYSKVNQVKSTLKNTLNEIGRVEGQAEFSAQIKLIDQLMINYLDLCDAPEKCDEYLTKAMVQLENLESRFAQFDDFVLELADKREELYNGFESRKTQLVAERNQRTSTMMASAERVLKGIANRVKNFKDINEINGYFASDLMIDRIRETVKQLTDLGDSVKAEDIKGRLKTVHQDAVRQLKDKLALYEDGDTIIRLGTHRFTVNQQALTGTLVRKDNTFCFHLTGTGFYEPITLEQLEATRAVWDLELVSESPTVYRAQYLAFRLLQDLKAKQAEELTSFKDLPTEEIIPTIQTFMGPRYDEGYIKGVHDVDAAIILQALLRREAAIGLLRYSTQARALAAVFWALGDHRDTNTLFSAKITGMGKAHQLFGPSHGLESTLNEIKKELEQFVQETDLFEPPLITEAADYLFYQLKEGSSFVVSQQAMNLKEAFLSHLNDTEFTEHFTTSSQALAGHALSNFRLIRDWARSYLAQAKPVLLDYADQIATLLLPQTGEPRTVIAEPITAELQGLVGSHRTLENGRLCLNYCTFMQQLHDHEQRIVPAFTQFQTLRNDIVAQYTEDLRLDEFKPQVMTTFVRNRLIDQIYLPLIGDNLAKQIGSAGDTKRTDRQGLLLLISPPGYGKTCLMEYVANRLGLTFIKINGPTIGHRVLSFDPNEAPNAAARDELNKLNLAFEMSDNVMIYVDDIQHTNPEFLQKFISLCDSQRRVDGVYKGKAQTYDLRGKRACVIMAGNPYTESGEKFKIPDMLANRADTYNIGDIVGDSFDQFAMSYIENCLTSNPVLEGVTRRNQNDAYSFMKIAETGHEEGIDFEGNYTVEEVNEYVQTMKKLFTVREVVLKVNQEYIRSAGQSAEYRTEPPFLLQGSYRNMNRIGARVLPMMNKDELWTLIVSTYEQDAQTLTTGAEANLLKFKELTGRLDAESTERWADIKKTFQRNLLLGGQADDNMGRLMGQLNAFSSGLDSIKEVLSDGVTSLGQSRRPEPEAVDKTDAFQDAANAILTQMARLISEIKHQRAQDANQVHIEKAAKVTHDTNTLLSVLEEQFHAMETWLMPMTHDGLRRDKEKVIGELTERFETMVKGYTKLIEVLKAKGEHKPYTPERPKPTKATPKRTKRKPGSTQG